MPSLSLILGLEQVVEIDGDERMDVLRALVAPAAREAEMDPDAMLAAVLEREELASTGFGAGLAMPHVRLAGIRRFHVVLGRTRAGVDFGAIDDAPVHVLLLVVGPAAERERYQKLLAHAARFLKAEGARLRECPDLRAAAGEALVEY